jgi:prepilin-type N-terminal cleavage/methylation domain-containing protein
MKPMKRFKGSDKRNRGFSLVETMVAVLVLTIVVGGIFSQINKAQQVYRVEGQKLDLTQEQRSFIDQFTRDLHQAGYPSTNSFNNQVGPNANSTATGLTSISTTSLTLEGDTDGSGVVQVVTYSYDDGSGFSGAGTNPCPCMKRSIAPKGQAAGTAAIAAQNIVAPGNGGIFTAYLADGSQVGINPAVVAPATLHTIKSVQVAVTLQATGKDVNGTPIQIGMTGMARLPNN